MKVLVIIPSLMIKYQFSAPLAWLFSDYTDKVRGIYSFKLNKKTVKQYNIFIVELNWYTQLYEFALITKFIKKHNPNALIMFGGLYSQLKYHEIFKRFPVDLFIKGDAELPMKMFLDGINPKEIPNMVGRDFENEQTYICTLEEYKNIKYNMDWIPEYFELTESSPEPSDDIETSFEWFPILPKYWDKKKNRSEQYKWRFPAKGGRYHLPTIITSKGGCTITHPGCEQCMGSKRKELLEIYKRHPIIMDNETLIEHLKDIEKKFDKAFISINAACNYDLSNYFFDLEVTIEIDSHCTPKTLKNIIYSFRKAVVNMAVYKEGLTGKEISDELQEYLNLEDENHKIYFFTHDNDSKLIPKNRRLYADTVIPTWANWDFYIDFDKAMKKSFEWYTFTGQVNLYPFPLNFISKFFSRIMMYILCILKKLKIMVLR